MDIQHKNHHLTMQVRQRLAVLILMTFGALVIFWPISAARADSGFDKDACTYNGFALYGAVQVVESFPDIKVQIVTSFADLHVSTVTSFADACGEWKFVDSFPDIKIQYVTSFPDVKIKMVSSFPGLQ